MSISFASAVVIPKSGLCRVVPPRRAAFRRPVIAETAIDRIMDPVAVGTVPGRLAAPAAPADIGEVGRANLRIYQVILLQPRFGSGILPQPLGRR